MNRNFFANVDWRVTYGPPLYPNLHLFFSLVRNATRKQLRISRLFETGPRARKEAVARKNYLFRNVLYNRFLSHKELVLSAK